MNNIEQQINKLNIARSCQYKRHKYLESDVRDNASSIEELKNELEIKEKDINYLKQQVLRLKKNQDILCKALDVMQRSTDMSSDEQCDLRNVLKDLG